MKFTNTNKQWIRRTHKWLAILVGIQIVVWVCTGLIISVIDATLVSGASTRQSVEPTVRPIPAQLFALDELDLPPESEIRTIDLLAVVDHWIYRIDVADRSVAYDAVSGQAWTLALEDAEKIARASYRGDGEYVGGSLFGSGHDEVRGKGPVWQFLFADEQATRVYISSVDGSVIAHRNQYWQWVDFLLMLHFMDYFGSNGFNSAHLILVAFLSLVLVVLGLFLVVTTFKKRHFNL